MNVALINTATGRVENIEIVEAVPANPDGYKYVEYTDDAPAWVGLGHSAAEGFEQPPVVNPWAADYVPPMADPGITAAEFDQWLANEGQ
jgi:hypothetical protein